ncbi:MAG: MFS transporter [Methanobrevibacter sp.]|nr:MFS transporter [Methanobrevibacter sp.]
MNVSISSVVADLNTDVSTIQSISSFYTLITAAFMLLSTKLQDIVGKKKLFLIGAALYGVGTLTAALSQNTLMLFAGWAVLEGLGGALMTPIAVSIISGTYHGDKRTFALAIESALVAIAAAIGPLFGGVVTTYFTWRLGFAVEFVIVLIIFALQSKIPYFEATGSKSELDITGAIVSFVGLVLFVIGILMLTDDTTFSISAMIVGLIVLAVFALFEIKRKRKGNVPLLDVELLKDRNLRVGTAIRLLVNLAMGGTLFAVSVYLQSVLALSAFNTGLTLLPMTLGLLLFAVAAPRLSAKLNHKLLMSIGCIVTIIGCLILSKQFTMDTTMLDLMPGMFVLGAGLGFVMALGVDIALSNISEEGQNNASGIVTTGQTLGQSMGTAIIGVILILGAIGGINDAVDTYAPEYSSDDAYHQGVYDYFQSIGSINDVKAENSTVQSIVNTIVKDSMEFVMYVTAALMAAIFVLTLRLTDKKIKKP